MSASEQIRWKDNPRDNQRFKRHQITGQKHGSQWRVFFALSLLLQCHNVSGDSFRKLNLASRQEREATNEGTGDSLCVEGQCLNPEGLCAREIVCFIDPCDMTTCNSTHNVCVANYCGGCHAVCTASENSSTINSPILSTDVSTELNSTQFGTQTNSNSREEGTVKDKKWWYSRSSQLPGGGECIFSSEYPSEWITSFPNLLYESKAQCCENHRDVTCLTLSPKIRATKKPTSSPSSSLQQKPTSQPENEPEKWYPKMRKGLVTKCVFGNDYKPWMGGGVNASLYLFDTEDECCIKHDCLSRRERKFWPKVDVASNTVKCVKSKSYPREFIGSALFDTKAECCAVFKCGATASTTSTTSSTISSSTTVTSTTLLNEGDNCSTNKWHVSTVVGVRFTCTNSKDYPPAWNSRPEYYLFETGEQCCISIFEKECTMTDVCDSNTVTTQPTGSTLSTTTSTAPKKWWASWENGSLQCVYSNSYPASIPSSYLYDSKEQCCARHNDLSCPTTSTTSTTTTTTTSDLSSYPFIEITDRLTSPIPWIFGSPPKWTLDSTTFAPLRKATLKNVPPVGEGASSNLTLKIKATKSGLFQCEVYIDTAMPFDLFYVEVDGKVNFASYSTSGGKWKNITTGLYPGEHTIQFWVKNNNVIPPISRQEGTGFVWLDKCEFKVV